MCGTVGGLEANIKAFLVQGAGGIGFEKKSSVFRCGFLVSISFRSLFLGWGGHTELEVGSPGR